MLDMMIPYYNSSRILSYGDTIDPQFFETPMMRTFVKLLYLFLNGLLNASGPHLSFFKLVEFGIERYHAKSPLAVALMRINITNTAQCRLRHAHEESLDHFLVLCPNKQTVWAAILQCFYATEALHLDEIYNMLVNLEAPINLRYSQYASFITVLSTTLWYIWFFYWQFIFHDKPFQTDIVIDKSISQISLLQNSPTLD
jgi:hypothetical protein